MKKIIILVAILFTSISAHAETYKIRWVMAHNPTNEPVLKLIKEFGDNLKTKSKNKINVELIALTDADKHRHAEGAKRVRSGEAEISQVSVATLSANTNLMDLLDLPYLFQDHAQVKRTLDGEAGKLIVENLLKGSDNKLQGLAFTYSGGFRVIAGSKKITTLEDFKNLKTPEFDQGRVGPRALLFKKLGVKFADKSISSRDDFIMAHEKGLIDFEDNELNRLYVLSLEHPEILNKVKFVTETNHSLYLTLIIVNKAFLNKLPANLQALIKSEVQVLAEKERKLSIVQADIAKDYLMKKGVTFSSLTPEALKKIKEYSLEIREKYKSQLGSLIEMAK